MNQLQRSTLRTAGVLFLSAFCVALKCSDDDSSSAPDEETTGGASGGRAGATSNGGDNQGASTNRGGSGGAVSGVNAGDGGALSGDTGGGGNAGFSGNDAAAGASGDGPEGGTGGETAAVAGTGGQGAATEPEVLVPFGVIVGLSSPQTMAVNEEYVYWTSAWVGADPPTPLPQRRGAYVMRVPKNGGEPSALFDAIIEVDGQPHQLVLSANFAIDATSIYVSAGLDIYNSLMFKVAKDGSGVEQIAVTPGLDPKRHLLIVGETLYFEAGSGGIDSVSVNGGPIVPVIDPETTPYAEGFNLFPAVSDMASDGANLYFSGNVEGMFKVPIGGGQPVLLSPRNTDSARFSHFESWPAVADGFLYWNYYGYIYRVSVDGGELETFVEPTEFEKSGSGPQTVIDDGYIYYNAYGLQKAALDGSSRVRLLDPALGYSAGQFAIDDTHVYMAAYSGQGIIKLPK